VLLNEETKKARESIEKQRKVLEDKEVDLKKVQEENKSIKADYEKKEGELQIII